MRTVLCVLLLATVPATAGIRGRLHGAFNATERFITHPQTTKVGFYVFWIGARGFADALVDAHRWDSLQPATVRGQTRIINDRNWHVYKNLRDLCTIIAGGFAGLAVGKGYVSIWHMGRRFLWASALAYPTWRNTYTYSRWGDAWDTSAAHNQHYFVYPSPRLQDRFVGLSGWQVSTAHSTFYAVGAIGALCWDLAQENP